MKDYDFSTKEGTIRAIRNEAIAQGFGLSSQVAYILATVQWETNNTFQPVREAYYISRDFDTAEAWRQKHLRYYPYYGRGLTQITWGDNYRRYTAVLRKYFPEDDIDLVVNPDQALQPEYALIIMLDGFKTGGFTGKKLTDYCNDQGTDYVNARRCINGTDHAEDIAAIAEKFQAQIEADS